MQLHELLLIYRPWRNGRLSWPGWLTYSGHLTHEVWAHANHRSGVDQRMFASLTTEPRRRLIVLCVCLCVAGEECISMVDLLEAEYQLFSSALYGSNNTRASSAGTCGRQHLINEFLGLQQRHAALITHLLRSNAALQQVRVSVARWRAAV